METAKVIKKERGMVVSKSGDKSVVVQIDYTMKHPYYGKYIRRRTKLAVHDPANAAGVGDVVEITPCRPISKRKSWRLMNILQKAVNE
jgi:small subunit ribosomal protein S17